MEDFKDMEASPSRNSSSSGGDGSFEAVELPVECVQCHELEGVSNGAALLKCRSCAFVWSPFN